MSTQTPSPMKGLYLVRRVEGCFRGKASESQATCPPSAEMTQATCPLVLKLRIRWAIPHPPKREKKPEFKFSDFNGVRYSNDSPVSKLCRIMNCFRSFEKACLF